MNVSVVRGVGRYLPANVVPNNALPPELETSDEWIRPRTGITQRHLAAADETTSDLATHAARDALVHARVATTDVDLVIVATCTPERAFPAVATQVQSKLGIRPCAAMDVNAACSGFVYAMSMADAMLRTGQAKTALVIGAEVFSRVVDWSDRTTCVLFGDGAGAVVLQAAGTSAQRMTGGIIGSRLYADGAFGEMLYTDGGPASPVDAPCHLRMKGREVFKHAVEKMASVAQELLSAHKLSLDDIDWVIPHQANQRILEAVGERIGLPEHKLISTVAQHANTSAASIPLAWSEALRDGRIQPGQRLLLLAMGAGFTWGAMVVEV